MVKELVDHGSCCCGCDCLHEESVRDCVRLVKRYIPGERLELSDTMHDEPMQTGRPNGVRSSDWLDDWLMDVML